jgi:hypothetical protein
VELYWTYRFEVRATPAQRARFCRIAGSCRFVYNKALTLQRARMFDGERRLSYEASCEALARWKAEPECAWLSDCPSQALQQSLQDLDRAYGNLVSGRTDPEGATTTFACRPALGAFLWEFAGIRSASPLRAVSAVLPPAPADCWPSLALVLTRSPPRCRWQMRLLEKSWQLRDTAAPRPGN